MKTRLRKALFICLLLAAMFFALYALYLFLNVGIPCPFNLLTGLQCPACGTFRMLVALFKADFIAAFSFNPIMLMLLPFNAVILISYSIRYIKHGTKHFTKCQTALAIGIIIVLVIYGVARNIH